MGEADGGGEGGGSSGGGGDGGGGLEAEREARRQVRARREAVTAGGGDGGGGDAGEGEGGGDGGGDDDDDDDATRTRGQVGRPSSPLLLRRARRTMDKDEKRVYDAVARSGGRQPAGSAGCASSACPRRCGCRGASTGSRGSRAFAFDCRDTCAVQR